MASRSASIPLPLCAETNTASGSNRRSSAIRVTSTESILLTTSSSGGTPVL